jgi:hypothetical protein
LKWIPIFAALGIDISPMFDQVSNYFGAIVSYRRLKWIPIFAALGIDISPMFDQVSNYFVFLVTAA